MKITVSHVGFLHLKGVKNNSTIEVDDSTTVEALLDRCGVKKEHQRYIVPVVNEKKRDLSYRLKNHDSLFLYLPIGGG